jgi:hypothetical protein
MTFNLDHFLWWTWMYYFHAMFYDSDKFRGETNMISRGKLNSQKDCQTFLSFFFLEFKGLTSVLAKLKTVNIYSIQQVQDSHHSPPQP